MKLKRESDHIRSAKETTTESFTNGLSIEVINSEGRFEMLADEWNALVEKADVHIFQTWEWQHTWWKYFGKENQLHILLVRVKGRLTGIIPLFLDSFKVMGLPVYRCLKLLGSKVMQPKDGSFPVDLAFGDYLNLIVQPGCEKEIIGALKKYLENNLLLFDEIILEEIPEGSPLLSDLIVELVDDGWKVATYDASVCLQIHFPSTWDKFLSGLSRRERKHTRRSLRSITEENLFEIQTPQSEAEVSQSFQDLVNIHQQRWRNLGHPGIFADQRILNFFRELTLCFHKKGWLWITTAIADGKCIAHKLMFRHDGKIVYGVQSGFDDSSPLSTYSPGRGLFYATVREAIEKDFKIYDFLRGEDAYKLHTSNYVHQNKNVFIRHPGKRRISMQFYKFYRNYEYLKRKLRNERFVFDVHFQKNNPLIAIGKYAKSIYQRISRRVNN